ncbi:YicC/YloC family endoribonuclease [Salmonirosea aquatica]|uniref:YicC family protein n=1 Tax=Salmonirosea aquatica TaxID=2654236 RepID=A0A7C9FXC6_9BACT|nr:YicC family protein [Cytophagaceae bacterium SJW1-29]
MLKSMTGYGTATFDSDSLSVTVEIKTLNSKFLDIYCRIPRQYSEREIEIRNLLTQVLERGKVELNLTIQPKGTGAGATVVNRALINAYYRNLVESSQELGIMADPTELFKLCLQMPNAYQTDVPDDARRDQDWGLIQKTVHEAIDRCNTFRKQEGKLTADKLEDYIGAIRLLLLQIQAQDSQRIPAVRERLEKQVKDLLSDDNYDPNRFEQELIYYIEKYDISEEKVRLGNHLDYFLETLNSLDSNGKKLNFIAQEIGREINTIGSKANDATVQRLVVQMKDELEKIKEQTMNVI